MFLDGLRAKSIYRKIKKELKGRSSKPFKQKVKTVAILQNEEQPFSSEYIKLLAKSLKIHEKDISKMTLVKAVAKEDKFETDIFSEKQIGWNGVLKSIGLKDFSKKTYDLLINYYTKDTLPLVAVTALSHAQFKVGLTEDLASMNDLIVNVPLGQEELLIGEMIKYMHILNIVD